MLSLTIQILKLVNGNELTYDVSSLVNSINKPGLKIGCLNVRGLLGEIDEIRDLLRLTKFDIMCLCETFIDCNVAVMKSAFKNILLY